MRKLFLLMPCLGAIMLILFFSCKKENTEADTRQTPTNEKLISKIKSWLDGQKKDLSTATVARIDSLKLNLSYGELRLEKYIESKELIVIPVLSGFTSRNNSDKDPANYLVMVFENQDSITRGDIIQYISSNSQKTAPKNTFSKIFTYQDLDCSGQFTILGITDQLQLELKFEKGKLRSMAWLKKKTNSNNVSGRVNECIDWYLQTWYVWSDGTVQLVSEVYVFTTCDGECWQPRIANGRIFRVADCGGGGGGGEGENCCLPTNTGFQLVSQAVSENVSYTCGYEAVDPNSGLLTKTCLKSWKFNKNTILWYSWYHISREQAIEENEAGIWKFKTVTHVGVDQEGQLPPCVEYTFTLSSSTPSITNNRTRAQMSLTYTSSLRVTCFSWATPSYSSGYSSTQWDAE